MVEMLDKSRILRKPAWLNKKVDLRKCEDVKRLLKDLNLNTICQHALCPNISECFAEGIATFLILGTQCSRGCEFCNVTKATPLPVDSDEPRRVAEAVRRLGLVHVVVTSVTRDDLEDGGASIFNRTVLAIKNIDDSVIVEVLVSDFNGAVVSVKEVLDSNPDIFAHNVETVPSLYDVARSGSDYSRSLRVLEMSKTLNRNIYTKSGIMLGLGEDEQEVLDVFCDLRAVGCDFLSIGQYISPSPSHIAVKEYIPEKRFEFFKGEALEAGFHHVESGPYVRSSYLASRYISSI